MSDRFLLFIFNTKIFFDLLILIVVSGLSYFVDGHYDDPFLFTSTVLAFCYMAYYEFLTDQKNRIGFFYTARTIKNIRFYTIKSCIQLSIVFVPIAIVIGILSSSLFNYLFYYLLSLASFFLANYLVPINVEKRRKGAIITVKNLLSSVGFCLGIVVLVSLINMFIFKN